MNSAKNFIYNTGTYLDFLKDSYSLLIKSYNSLCSDGYDAGGKNENKIRNDLIKIAEKLPSSLKYEWIPESVDLDKSNRIDIDLITPLSFGVKEKRLKIECKIVGEDEYINRNGISSFVSGKYADKMPLAGMIGLIKKGDIVNKIDNIKLKINTHKTIKTIQNLVFYQMNKKFKYSYLSKHKRINKLPKIDLYHLFFNFNSKK